MDKCLCAGLLLGAVAGAMLYKKSDGFKNIINKADAFFMWKAEKTQEVVKECAQDVKQNIQNAVNSVSP